MSHRILYLGLDPQNWPHKDTLLHYPVIRTERLDSETLQEALRQWPQFTHVVFTSRSAVRHWWEVEHAFGQKIAIAIGEGTAGELRMRGVEPLLALEALQEGVIALLESMDLSGAHLFLPLSKRARPALRAYLVRKQIRFQMLDLYDTILQKPEPVPSLESIDEIVFTSPSTVEGFLNIYGSFPVGKKYTAIGPITQKAFEELFARSTEMRSDERILQRELR